MRYQFLSVLFVTLMLINGCGTQKSPETPPLPQSQQPKQSTQSLTTPTEDTSQATPEEPLDPGTLLPAQLDPSMLNQVVKIRGQIVQVIQNPGGQGGYYFNVSGGGGEVGLRIDEQTWNKLTTTERANYKQGSVITFKGILVQPGADLVVVLVVTPSPSELPKAQIANAVVIPSDITKINYPEFYNNPTVVKDVIVENAYCAIDKDEVAYPIEYLGEYEFPNIVGAPLPSTIQRLVGLKDVWIPEPNKNEGCTALGYDVMREAFEKTLPRVKALDASGITLSNYVHFLDFENAIIDGPEKAAMPEGDFRFAASNAKEQGLDVVLYLNLAPGNEPVSWDIPNEAWLTTLIRNWGEFVLNQAKIAEDTEIDAIMLNHFDYQPGIHGFEDVFQTEMLALLQKVRDAYTGKVLLMIEPIWGADLNKLDILLRQVDAFLISPVTIVLESAPNKTVSVNNLKSLYLKYFEEIGRDFGRYGKPVYLRVLIQSTKVFLEEGWHEEMFCIQRGIDPCYQKSLEVDFSAQAIAYEAMMEAIKEASGNYLDVGAVDSYGYWYTDVILPDVSQPQIGQSVRNKPAESIVKQWFTR
jgi:hypothetical protein